MKKWLLKTLAAAPAIACSTVPLFNLTSCTSESKILDQLEETTINEFKAFAHIPRPSDLFLYEHPDDSNCKNISNYLKQRVFELTGITANQDKYANLWFDVPCNSDKYKNCPTIALQCHMDMVFAYDPTKMTDPDPLTTEIDIVDEIVDGKRTIHSRDNKTSIGADNGIGIAGILALISNKNVKHGNLRVIFTNCEENAMQGAMMLVDGHRDDSGVVVQEATAPNIMHGVKYVINLDTGINKSVCVSSSGAIGSHYKKDFTGEEITLQNKFKLSVTGFTGGHSAGVPRQGLGNAIKAANEVLEYFNFHGGQFELMSYSTPGTKAYNNVPSNCIIEFATNLSKQHIDGIIEIVKENHTGPQSKEYWKDMENVTFDVTDPTTQSYFALSIEDSLKVMNLQQDLWYGFDKEAWDTKHIKTSANVGPTTLSSDGSASFHFESSSYSRSDDEDKVKEFKQSNLAAAAKGDFNYQCDAQFHPWVRDRNTKLLNLTKDAIASTLGCDKNEIQESEAHGGLECTWWAYAMKNIEHIDDGASTCLGINVKNEHKFTEAVDVASIKDCMKAVIYIFKHFKQLI